MHIIHVLTRLKRSGSEENTIETCRWQLAAGHRVTLVYGAEADPIWDRELPKELERVQIKNLVHKPQPSKDFRACRELRALYKRLKPDVIHTHQSKAGIIGRLAAARLTALLVVHGVHIISFENVSPIRRACYVFIEKIAARYTDLFIAVSQATRDAYIASRITPASKIFCVYSGVDLERFSAAMPPPDWAELLGVSSGQELPKVAVMVAAFERRKGHVKFLNALAQKANMLHDIKIVFAGSGPEEENIRSEIRAVGLQDRVVISGHRSDPEALFKAADLSILTSEREGLPRVLVQSIAAGCPVISSELQGYDEVISSQSNGILVGQGDLDGLINAMLALLNDLPRLDRMRRSACNTDLSRWSLKDLGARSTALYERSLGRI